MKTNAVAAALLCTLTLTVCSADAQTAPPKTEEEKTLYAIGVLLSQSLQTFELKPEEVAMVQRGLSDSLAGKKPAVEAEAYLPKVQELQKARMEIASAKAAKAGVTYLENAAKEKGATKTASGIIITHTKPGTGAAPTAEDQVKVHYEGKLIDGKTFDSSVARGEPATFPLSGVIPCWTEGVQLMKVGGKAKLVCPASLAYGDRGSPPNILPGSTLVFDVELLEIVKGPEAPAPGP